MPLISELFSDAIADQGMYETCYTDACFHNFMDRLLWQLTAKCCGAAVDRKRLSKLVVGNKVSNLLQLADITEYSAKHIHQMYATPGSFEEAGRDSTSACCSRATEVAQPAALQPCALARHPVAV